MQVLRIGNISSVDYKNGTAEVTYEDRDSATTNSFPYLAWTYWMPQVGDTVLVGHLASGATAVILGPFWTDKHKPAASGAGIYRQEMSHTPGKAFDSYSESTGNRTIHAGQLTFETNAGTTTLASILSRISSLETRCENHGI